MGGHAAWRKRVAAGELAKGSGGAALRHRPRLGRKGTDLALNRLGNLGGHGNPKRKITKRTAAITVNQPIVTNKMHDTTVYACKKRSLRMEWFLVLFIIIIVAMYVAIQFTTSIPSLKTFPSQ